MADATHDYNLQQLSEKLDALDFLLHQLEATVAQYLGQHGDLRTQVTALAQAMGVDRPKPAVQPAPGAEKPVEAPKPPEAPPAPKPAGASSRSSGSRASGDKGMGED
jgi:cell division protein FtsN